MPNESNLSAHTDTSPLSDHSDPPDQDEGDPTEGSKEPPRSPMTNEEQAESEGETSGTSRLEELASRLAKRYAVTHQGPSRRSPLDHMAEQEELLRDAYEHFARTSESQGALSYTAEWLLDNYYVIEQACRQVREDMPKGYHRRLPKLDNTPLKDRSRVYALAQEIIKYSEGRVDMDRVTRLIRTYQQLAPSDLTMGELWALPTMLRLVILGLLTWTVARTAELEAPPDATMDAFASSLDDVPEETIDDMVDDLRLENYGFLRGGGRRLAVRPEGSPDLFDQLGSCQIPVGSVVEGHSIGELGIRAATGVTIIAVRRHGRLIRNPGADFRLQSGDELSFVGSREERTAASQLLVMTLSE